MPTKVVEVVTPTEVNPIDAKSLLISMIKEAETQEKSVADRLCAAMKAVGLAAKDLHYRAKGESFYSNHLLADLVGEIEILTDDFIEVYYMGNKGWEPPLMGEIYSKAVDMLPEQHMVDEDETAIQETRDVEYWIARLLGACEILVNDVEVAKEALSALSGTQAILDEISKQTLQSIALLKQTLKKQD